jgi:hypothetical protein
MGQAGATAQRAFVARPEPEVDRQAVQPDGVVGAPDDDGKDDERGRHQ